MKKFANFKSNLAVLAKSSEQDLTNAFIVSGIIDKFFIQFELGWKLLKELLAYDGRPMSATGSPRSIIKEAYKIYDFMDEELWLEMLAARNDMSHIYDGERANDLVQKIITRYIPEFQRFEKEICCAYGDGIKKL